MECQSLFSGKNKNIIINLLSDEFAQREVKVQMFYITHTCSDYEFVTNAPFWFTSAFHR